MVWNFSQCTWQRID
uniref:Uncharacterized protein n=1 Tax=Arundo donax TaxID=35708 RepID=A0A0A9B0E9_ARUDO